MAKEQTFMQRLKELGAKSMDLEKEKAFLAEVENEVIPAILRAEREQRRLVHNLWVRPFLLPQKGS